MPHDKAFWQAVADADYAVPEGEAVRALTGELLGYLGSADMALRDGTAYTVLAHWTMRGVLSPEDLRFIMARVMPDMQRGIGEAGDGVILRSFSALVLSLVAYGDWKNPFITPEEYAAAVDAACAYLSAETDLRGYVAGLGWLHATAHTADILKFLARGRHANPALLAQMLTAIGGKFAAPTDYIYVHNEDERAALAVLDILKREMLTAEQVTAFVVSLRGVIEIAKAADDFDPFVHAPLINVKNLLRALYFRLSFAEPPIAGTHDLAAQAFETLKMFGI